MCFEKKSAQNYKVHISKQNFFRKKMINPLFITLFSMIFILLMEQIYGIFFY